MKIVFGCDHAGFKLKAAIFDFLRSKKHQVIDLGCAGPKQKVDYPDYAQVVGEAVSSKKADFGILCCGTGIGMCISANKVKGVRAAVVWDKKSAGLAKEHNWANVLCLGGRLLSARQAAQALSSFLTAKPSQEPRHKKRIGKIVEMEQGK